MSKELPPIAIELLIWFHTRGELPARTSDVGQHWVSQFLEWGVIDWWTEREAFTTTERGKAWVKLLCRTPPPEVVYVDQHGAPIEE